MFDIGFWELALIGVIALLVVGPERLPELARFIGLWVGRARAFMTTVKADVQREMKETELQSILDKQRSEVHDIIESADSGLRDLKSDLDQAVNSADASPPATPAPPAEHKQP